MCTNGEKNWTPTLHLQFRAFAVPRLGASVVGSSLGNCLKRSFRLIAESATWLNCLLLISHLTFFVSQLVIWGFDVDRWPKQLLPLVQLTVPLPVHGSTRAQTVLGETVRELLLNVEGPLPEWAQNAAGPIDSSPFMFDDSTSSDPNFSWTNTSSANEARDSSKLRRFVARSPDCLPRAVCSGQTERLWKTPPLCRIHVNNVPLFATDAATFEPRELPENGVLEVAVVRWSGELNARECCLFWQDVYVFSGRFQLNIGHYEVRDDLRVVLLAKPTPERCETVFCTDVSATSNKRCVNFTSCHSASSAFFVL